MSDLYMYMYVSNVMNHDHVDCNVILCKNELVCCVSMHVYIIK